MFSVNKKDDNNPFMVHPDRRNNIPSRNERFSGQIIENVDQTLYKTKAYPITTKIRDLYQHSITMRTKEGNLIRTKNPRVVIGKPKMESNRRETIKLILSYYKNHYQFSWTENQDCRRHILVISRFWARNIKRKIQQESFTLNIL